MSIIHFQKEPSCLHRCLAMFMVLAANGVAQAALQAEGVIAELKGGRNTVLATRLRPTAEPDRVALVAPVILHGTDREIPKTLSLDPLWARAVDPHRDYLVVYTAWRHVYGPTKYIPDPSGGKVINVSGLDPAIVLDTPRWRQILTGNLPGWPDQPRRFSRTVRKLTKDGDLAVTNLLAHELLTNPRLFTRLDKATIDWLAALAIRRDMPAELRAQILDSAAARDEFIRPEFFTAAVGILSCTLLPLDWQSSQPRLVLSALNFFERRPPVSGDKTARRIDDDLDRLIRAAEHPAAIEKASALLFAADPQRTLRALAAAREKALLAPEVRRVLERLAGTLKSANIAEKAGS